MENVHNPIFVHAIPGGPVCSTSMISATNGSARTSIQIAKHAMRMIAQCAKVAIYLILLLIFAWHAKIGFNRTALNAQHQYCTECAWPFQLNSSNECYSAGLVEFTVPTREILENSEEFTLYLRRIHGTVGDITVNYDSS